MEIEATQDNTAPSPAPSATPSDATSAATAAATTTSTSTSTSATISTSASISKPPKPAAPLAANRISAAAAAAADPPQLNRASRLDVGGLALQRQHPRCTCCKSLEVSTSTGCCNPR